MEKAIFEFWFGSNKRGATIQAELTAGVGFSSPAVGGTACFALRGQNVVSARHGPLEDEAGCVVAASLVCI